MDKAGISYQIVGDETLFDVIFTDTKCLNYRTTKHDEPDIANEYNRMLRAKGVLKAPTKLYPSLSISELDLEQTNKAVITAVNALSNSD